MPHPDYDNVNTRKAHDVPTLADRLARLLTKRLGVKVYRADAVNLAVREAVEREEAAAKEAKGGRKG